MPQFEFRSRIAELTGAPHLITEEVSPLLASTHKITKASDASRIPALKVRAHVVAVVLDVAKDRLLAALQPLLEAHLEEVGQEHEAFLGECPSGDGEEEQADLWQKGLLDAIYESLQGDVAAVAGEAELQRLVYGGAPVYELAAAVCMTPVHDEDRALRALGLVHFVAQKVEEIRKPPAAKVAGALASAAEAEYVESMFDDTAAPSPCLYGSMELCEEPELMVAGDMVCGTCGAVKALLTEIPALVPTQSDPIVVVRQRHLRAGRPEGTGAVETTCSEAARALLTVLSAHAGVTDNELAEAIGVSRAQLNNYRKAKHVFAPDALQAKRLLSLAEKTLTMVTDAASEFRAEQELQDGGL